MRRVLITLLSLSIWSSANLAQEIRHTYSEPFRRPALDVALASEVIWIADGYGVTVASRQNPPAVLGSKALDGRTFRIAIEGGKVWVVSGTTLYGVSWDGREIVIESERELGESVFDIVGARGFLYLATLGGVVQIDPGIPASRLVLGTTAGIAASLATDGSTLVAADGDTTADVYDIEFPALAQKIGVADLSITSANHVHVVDGNLLVSNGRDSQMFSGLRPPLTSLGVFSFGASSAGVTTPGIVFTAGQDTTVRLVDLRLSAGRPSVVFEERFPPSSGTLNQIFRIRSDGNLVWIAAGDLGLQTYDIVDFGVPFPIVRSLVKRADAVVDLGNGQVVATGGNEPPRLYTIEQSGGLRETIRWEDQFGVTVLDHDAEVAVVAIGGTVRLVRPSGTVTGELSFGAAVRSGVVIDGMIWVTLADQSLWRVPVSGGTPERVEISGSNPTFLARGSGRLILGSFNDDGTTTIHEIDRENPSQSQSVNIDGLATSGAGVGLDTIAVATFRGLSLLDLPDGERLVSLGEGVLPRALEVAGDEIVVLASDRVQRRRASDGSVIREIGILSSGLSLSSESSSRVVVGASDAIYTLDLETAATLPELLGRLRESQFFSEMVANHGVVHLIEGDAVFSRVLQNQSVSASSRTTQFDGDLVGAAATPSGFCGLGSRGRVDCFNFGGELVSSEDIPAQDDVSFLSIHGAGDAALVSLLEGCFGSGCRKRTVVGVPQSGAFVIGSEIEGEIVALSESDGRFAVLTELPREIRVYEIASSSATLSLVASREVGQAGYAIELDSRRNTVYVMGERITAYALPGLDEVGQLLEPFDSTSGLSAVDQRMEIIGDRAIVSGRSRSVLHFRIDGPASWTPLESIGLPGQVRRLVRDGATLILLTDDSIELLGTEPPPDRKRPVRR